MSDIDVELPDGSRRSLPEGSSALDLAGAIGKRLAKDALAAQVNGHLTDLTAPLPEGARVAIVTPQSELGREVIRHSSAHVLAQAARRPGRPPSRRPPPPPSGPGRAGWVGKGPLTGVPPCGPGPPPASGRVRT